MTETAQEVEEMFTIKELARRWDMSIETARKLCRGKEVNISTGRRPTYRIAASVAAQIMRERTSGSAPEGSAR